MNVLINAVDFILAGLAIYASVALSNVLYPHRSSLSRKARQSLLPFTRYDHILLGAAVVGVHGLLAIAAAVAWLPYTALILSLTSFIDAAMVMRTLASLKRELPHAL